MKTLKELRREWITEEQERRSGSDGRRAKRRYLHFDPRVSLSQEITNKIWMPNFIVGHSFYPFIRYVMKQRRLRNALGSQKKLKLKKRDIDYAAHEDALIFSWYAYLLADLYEEIIKKENIDKNITAYRKGLGESNVDFAKRVFDYIKKIRECSVLCLDIEKFFPSLDHKILKRNWAHVIAEHPLPEDHYYLYKVLTRFAYVPIKKVLKALGLRKFTTRDRICSSEEFRKKIVPLIRENKKSHGIPQGSPISAILSNIYMIDFDKAISRYVESIGGLYQRYCDDIILVAPSDAKVDEIEETVFNEIKKINLEINPSKLERRLFFVENETLVCVDSETKKKLHLKYLGIEFDGRTTYLRHSGIGKYEKKLKSVVDKGQKLLEKKKRSAFPKKKVYEKFYHSRKSNFISYATRAAKALESETIKRQVMPSRIIKKIRKQIEVSKG